MTDTDLMWKVEEIVNLYLTERGDYRSIESYLLYNNAENPIENPFTKRLRENGIDPQEESVIDAVTEEYIRQKRKYAVYLIYSQLDDHICRSKTSFKPIYINGYFKEYNIYHIFREALEELYEHKKIQKYRIIRINKHKTLIALKPTEQKYYHLIVYKHKSIKVPLSTFNQDYRYTLTSIKLSEYHTVEKNQGYDPKNPIHYLSTYFIANNLLP